MCTIHGKVAVVVPCLGLQGPFHCVALAPVLGVLCVVVADFTRPAAAASQKSLLVRRATPPIKMPMS
jgi:hypothetical protein